MPFSSDDIQASIEKLVLSSIRRPFDTLGTRRVDISFNDVQEAAAGVFLLVTSAPFYVAFLGAKALLELIEKENEIISELLAAIEATGRKVFPIKDLTSLSNASAALFELEAAVGRRSQSFKTIENVPAYQRFKMNLDQFLTTAGSNIKASGVIVQTPQEARAAIPNLVSSLEAAHTEIVRRAITLAAALDDYAKVNLPSLAAAGVIARARQLVQQHTQALESLGEKERLSVIRPIILDLLSSKAVVKKYGSFVAPTSVLGISGAGTPYSDAFRPALGAVAVGDQIGPYAIVSGKNTIDLRLDASYSAKVVGIVNSISQVNGYKAQFSRVAGSFISDGVVVGDIVYVSGGANDSTRWMVVSVSANTLQAMGSIIPQAAGVTSIEIWPAATESIPLALSYVASIEGSAREPFNPVLGTSDSITLSIAGSTNTFTLDSGSQSAQYLCTTLNTQLAGFGLGFVAVAEPYLSPLRYDGIVDVTTSGITGTFTLQVGKLDGLGVVTGDLIQIMSGPNAGLVVAVTVVPGAPITYIKGDDAALVATIGIRIQIGAAGRKVRIRFRNASVALSGSQKMSIGSDAQSAATSLALGFPTGATFISRRTTATELVTDFNGKTSRGKAARILTPITAASLGRSKPDDVSAVVLYLFRGKGDVTASVNAISVVVTEGGLLASGVQPGDTIVLRSGIDPDSIWTITSTTDTTIDASGIITTSSATELDIEIGPTLVSPAGRLLQIASGPNAGDFTVASSGPVPFDLFIEGFLPVFKDGFTQPVFFSLSLCEETISISSKNATTASSITVNGFGALVLSSVVPFSGDGTTTWFKLPSPPGDLRAGDFLDLHATDYRTPSDSFAIQLVDKATGIIQLDHPINSKTNWMFGDQAPPFARLRSGRVFDYSVMQTRLTAWASLAANQPAFFIDLNRFLNPLLVNENPTNAQINDAKTRLLSMANTLSVAGAALVEAPEEATLEAALRSYVVEPVPEVDTLFKTFREKGSDRALDLLTEGQFTTFFGLSLDGASYAGDMQEKMRLVARQDLPVRKVDRTDVSSSRQLAEVEDVDYEYSKDDIDDVQIDPPID